MFRVVLLDQRGTGLSTPVTQLSLQRQGAAEQQAAYLKHFRWAGVQPCPGACSCCTAWLPHASEHILGDCPVPAWCVRCAVSGTAYKPEWGKLQLAWHLRLRLPWAGLHSLETALMLVLRAAWRRADGPAAGQTASSRTPSWSGTSCMQPGRRKLPPPGRRSPGRPRGGASSARALAASARCGCRGCLCL